MTWFRHEEDFGHDTLAVDLAVERGDAACSLRLPLQATDEQVCAWLNVTYDIDAPLTIDIVIRSPSGAPALERTVLRSDMRTALFEPVLIPGLTIGPAGAPGMVAFVFQEESIALPVTLPAPVFAEFLRACDSLVPMNERAEAMALTRALETAQRRWL